MIFAIILLVLLVLSVIGNFGQFVSGVVTMGGTTSKIAGPKLDEMTLEDNDSPNKIAVIEVNGIISSAELDQTGYNLSELVQAQLDRVEDDRKVRAVILKVNSPGGEVLASDNIYRAISEFQKKTGKPVVASMGSLAASGGYYISTPCRWIVANELTLTGSIGVIMETWNYRGLMDKIGLRPVVYKSGKFKDMLSGARSTNEIPQEEHQMVQSLVDEVYGRFKTVVADGREQAHEKNGSDGHALSSDWQKFADGRVLSGIEAQQLGFVDELGDFQTAVKRAKKIAHISSADLIEYRQRYDLGNIFRLLSKTEVGTVKVDLGMELPKLEAGQIYFLPPFLLQ